MPTTVSRERTLIARVLCIGGLAGMFLGVLDPLEGSGAILAGTGLVALGAFCTSVEALRRMPC